MLSSKGQWRFEYDLTYANTDRTDFSARFQIIEIGDGHFLQIPSAIDENRVNSDVFAHTFGLRYGLTANTEIFSRLTGDTSTWRSLNGAGEADGGSSQRWSSLDIGINHRPRREQGAPALLGFAEITAVENTAREGNHFVSTKSGALGLTAWRSFDPLVLLLSAGYRHSAERRTNHHTSDPGDLVNEKSGNGLRPGSRRQFVRVRAGTSRRGNRAGQPRHPANPLPSGRLQRVWW